MMPKPWNSATDVEEKWVLQTVQEVTQPQYNPYHANVENMVIS